MEKRSDISVHSLKDMPMEVPRELPVLAYSKREDPRDVLVLPKGKTEIDFSKPVGCSSLRRILQLQRLYPQAKFESIRGNVQTRLRKLDAAGLKRLGLEERISRYFSVEEMLPAAGQGILAVQGRAGEDYSWLSDYQDEDAKDAALAERGFVKRLDGGCTSPVAAYARIQGEKLILTGLYYSESKKIYRKKTVTGDRKLASEMGIKLADDLKKETEGCVIGE